MYWTKTLIPTLREAPADAEILSHKLLLRAGLIRKLAGGVYTFLPLGLRALRKVENIIREEMNRAGAIEVLMPALQPKEIWEQSGRAEVVGRPALYSTTPLFLEYFGLRGLEDLPAADELRRIPIEKPPAPVTADAGLATAPPEQLQLDEEIKLENKETSESNPAPAQG